MHASVAAVTCGGHEVGSNMAVRSEIMQCANSQIAYRKLCARLFNYLILWVRVEGWSFE